MNSINQKQQIVKLFQYGLSLLLAIVLAIITDKIPFFHSILRGLNQASPNEPYSDLNIYRELTYDFT